MNTNNINEWSYQRYARFYGNLGPGDNQFNEKINKIYDLIVNKKYSDLDQIAKESGCTYDECIMKIKYLENKRMIENLHIDTLTRTIKECSKEDEQLLKKYSSFIYNNHYQIKEMAVRLPGASLDRMPEIEDQIFKEIEYLDSKGLINGISLNKETRQISYYTIEKHNVSHEAVTIKCPHCGAINDVNKNVPSLCSYCKKEILYSGDYTPTPKATPIVESTPTAVAPVVPAAAITPSAPVASNDLLNKVASKQVTDEDLLATFIGNNYNKILSNSFNFSAFFFGFYYFFFRKHYLFGIIGFLIYTLVPFLSAKLLNNVLISFIIMFVTSIIMAVSFNKSYVNMARKKVAYIKSKNVGIESDITEREVIRAGGTSRLFLIVSIIIYGIVMNFVVMSAITDALKNFGGSFGFNFGGNGFNIEVNSGTSR